MVLKQPFNTPGGVISYAANAFTCPERYLCRRLFETMNNFFGFVALLLSSLIPSGAFAQFISAPVFNCLEISPTSGFVDLDWDAPADPANEFEYYEIFASVNGGAFLDVTTTTLTYTQTGYTYLSAAALSNQVCFHVRSHGITAAGNAFSSPHSDTLCTIHLSYDLVDALNGLVEFDWTNPFVHFPVAAASNSEYVLLMEYPAGTWTSLGNFPIDSTSYTYTVPFCDPTALNFQVVLTAPNGCILRSNKVSGIFFDDVDPETPTVTSVSFNDAGQYVVEWNVNSSEDTQQYQIYQFTNAQTAIGIVTGITTTQYVYTYIGLPGDPQPGFTVAAFDNCISASDPLGNASPTQGYSYAIRLNSIPYAECSREVNISWSAYIGWVNGVEKYYIHRSLDGGLFEVIDSVAGNVLNYTDNNLTLGVIHSYYISALASVSGYRSRSNKGGVFITHPNAPDYTVIESASVSDDDKVTITLSTTNTNRFMEYILERERRFEPGVWEDIDIITSNNLASLSFVDADVNPDIFTYRYRVVLKNSCNERIDTTNIAETILLEGIEDNPNFTNILQWTPYREWTQGGNQYTLTRTNDASGSSASVLTASSIFFHQDDVSELWEEPGEFCYVIEATASAIPESGNVPIARSNEICLTMEPGIWVPNAFIYDSRIEERRTFGPVVSFADIKSYRMIVYSRWGDIIFDTTDIGMFWDGHSMRGDIVEEGIYVYYLTIEDGSGRQFERRGRLMFIVGPEP
jgi:hypothetical protein